ISRRYQRSFSKQMMKEIRYRLNCKTHRNGLTAMFWQIRFVVASNSTDAQADNPIQNRRSRHPAGASGRLKSGLDASFSAAGVAVRTALRAQKQPIACGPGPALHDQSKVRFDQERIGQ